MCQEVNELIRLRSEAMQEWKRNALLHGQLRLVNEL